MFVEFIVIFFTIAGREMIKPMASGPMAAVPGRALVKAAARIQT